MCPCTTHVNVIYLLIFVVTVIAIVVAIVISTIIILILITATIAIAIATTVSSIVNSNAFVYAFLIYCCVVGHYEDCGSQRYTSRMLAQDQKDPWTHSSEPILFPKAR